MTDKQPEALRLADAFGIPHWTGLPVALHVEAAAELRRLHEVNAELVEALKLIQIECNNLHHSKDHRHTYAESCKAKAWIDSVLTKAQGETALQRLNKAAEDNGEEL